MRSTKVRCRQNIGVDKSFALTKYWCQQKSGGASSCCFGPQANKLVLSALSYHRCRLHRQKIYWRCHWHWWTIFRQCDVDNGGKFFLAFWLFLTGINDTGEQIYRRYQRHQITENPWQGLITSDKFIAGVIDTHEQLITGVVDTGDNIRWKISPQIFKKKSKWSQGDDSWKKPEVGNLVSKSYFVEIIHPHKMSFYWSGDSVPLKCVEIHLHFICKIEGRKGLSPPRTWTKETL